MYAQADTHSTADIANRAGTYTGYQNYKPSDWREPVEKGNKRSKWIVCGHVPVQRFESNISFPRSSLLSQG